VLETHEQEGDFKRRDQFGRIASAIKQLLGRSRLPSLLDGRLSHFVDGSAQRGG
jgi:hypothetical protein